MKPEIEPERTYTLDEAAAELRRLECVKYGHSFDIVCADMVGIPLSLSCRCGDSWRVVK